MPLSAIPEEKNHPPQKLYLKNSPMISSPAIY